MTITFETVLEGVEACGHAMGNPAPGQKLARVLRKRVAKQEAAGKYKKAEKTRAIIIQWYSEFVSMHGAAAYAKFGVVLPGYVRAASRPPSIAPAPRQPSVVPAPRMPSVPPATPGMPSAEAITDAVRILRPYVAEFLASRRAA